MKIFIFGVTIFDLYSANSVAYLLKTKDESIELKLFLRDTLEKYITPEVRYMYSEIKLLNPPTLSPAFAKKSS